MGRLQDIYVNRTREYLKQVAQDMIEKARLEYEPEARSGTQLDSYGALIFYNGGLIYTLIPTHKDLTRQHFGIGAEQREDSERHKGWNGIPAGTGIEWAKMLREEIKAGAWGDIPKRGFCLIVFNAAFYTNPLEKGYAEGSGIRFRRKYKILSMIAGDMEAIQSKYKKQGATLRWHGLNLPDSK